MLRISIPKSTRDYFITSLSKGDYYSEQSEIIGKWEGLGSSKVGIAGNIQKAQFDLLCGGLHPVTGQKLTSRLSTKRREAYDLTFSTPKSVSLLYALASEKGALKIERITVQAMNETMKELEKNIQCRVRNKGQNQNRLSKNLIYGYFIHKNSRPIDGYADPHLHIHTVVMNITYDQVDAKWKAIEMRDKYENREYYQAIFNSKLAIGLQNIGLRTRKTEFNFELEGIFDQTKQEFSRRTVEINAEAIKKNIHDPKQKDKLGARTRDSKSYKLSQSELKEIYQNLISSDSSDNQKNWLDNLIRTVEPPTKPLQFQEFQTKKWFDYTLENTFERHSVISEQRFLGEVLKNGIGQTNIAEVKKLYQEYVAKGVIISETNRPIGQPEYYSEYRDYSKPKMPDPKRPTEVDVLTTRNNISPSITTNICLLEEENIIKLIESKMNRFQPTNPSYKKIIQQENYLNSNQKQVVSDIMYSSDGIELLNGKAGTGKTTTLKSIERGLRDGNRQVTILAPTTKAVEVLQLEGFENAMTIQKYLSGANIFTNKNQHPDKVKTFQENIYNKPINLTLKEELRTIPIKDYEMYTSSNNYLIVDEASLVSVRQMNQLLTLADNHSQRVLLVGDTKQHKSVERGNILKLIDDYSNITTHELSQIIRQKQTQAKSAVDDLSRGYIERGLSRFEGLGWIKEIQNDKQRLNKLAQMYVDNLPTVSSKKIKKDKIPVEKPYYQQANNPLSRMLKGRLPWDETKEFELVEKSRLEQVAYKKLTTLQTTLVVTPTHSDGHKIHEAIRDKLKEEKLIEKKDYTLNTIRSLSWTQAQKQESTNYREGQIIQFNRNVGEFTRGDKWEVMPKDAIQYLSVKKSKTSKPSQGSLTVDDSDSSYLNQKLQLPNQANKEEIVKIKNTKTKQIQILPITQNQSFEVYQKQDLKISKGDLVQTQAVRVILDTQNQPHHTSNGSVYQIKNIDAKTGDIKLSNNWILPKDFANLKSAYYSTSHASQGQTVNHSIFYTSNKSMQNLSQEMVYVANSRFKLTNTILTPDYQEFQQQAKKGEMNAVALDVRHPEIQINIQKQVMEKQQEIEARQWRINNPKQPSIQRERGFSMGR